MTDSTATPSPSDAATGAFVRTLGCKVNRVESDQISGELRSRVVAEETEASVIVINSCAVTSEAEKKTRKAIRHAASLPQHPAVVVTGCVAALDAEGLAALGDRVVVEADKSRVASVVDRILAARDLESAPARPSGSADRWADAAHASQYRTRRMLKVEDGCDCFCTYCIVPYARGGPVSVPLAEVTHTAQKLVEEGASEVVLTGINIGRYMDGATDLARVVRAVAETGMERIRISSIEPLDLTDRLLETLATTPAVCSHLHVPLQSGSDTVLSAMGRPYDSTQFLERIAAARAALPGLAVTTDVIVGFPGESDDDVAATVAVCTEAAMSKLHVFRYSRREGTPAAAMAGQVAAPQIAARAALLRDLGARLRREFVAARIGHGAQVLVERIDERGAWGTTEDYLKVLIERDGLAPGDTVAVRLTEAGRGADAVATPL